MCLAPKAPQITMPKLPAVTKPISELAANTEARNKRRSLQGDATSLDATGGLGDPSLAPVTKSTLGS